MIPIPNQRQLTKFLEIEQQTFRACLFDVDGTLTVRGDEFIPEFLQKELARTALQIPVGICTARKFDHAYQKIGPIFTHASDATRVQENFVMICENGCIGYFFESTLKKYQEFFRVPWPYDAKHFEQLLHYFQKILKEKIDVAFPCEVSMIFRPKKMDDADREALAHRARELANIIAAELPSLDPKQLLQIGDSGTGVTIFPAQGNKENGTREFAKFLREKKKLEIGKECREIIVAGDQPIYPGNDATFLDGRFGTAFTVGNIDLDQLWPLPVYNNEHKMMKGPEGIFTLLQTLSFKKS